MGEYEPNDSRNVTQKPSPLPGEPPRTGPREGESRAATKDGDHPDKSVTREKIEADPNRGRGG